MEGQVACGGLSGTRLLASTGLHAAGRFRYVSLSQSFVVALHGLLQEPRRPPAPPPTRPLLGPAFPQQLAGRCVNHPRSRKRGENARGPGRCHRISPAWLPPPGTGFTSEVGARTSRKQEREGARRGVPHSDLQGLSPLLSGPLCPHAQAIRGTPPAPRLHEACVWGVRLWDPGGSLFFCGSFQSKKAQFFRFREQMTPPFRF